MNEIRGDILEFLKTQGFLNEKISLQDNDSLSETGVIDSITLLQLVDFLESKYKIEIPVEMITPENFDTLAGISHPLRSTSCSSTTTPPTAARRRRRSSA